MAGKEKTKTGPQEPRKLSHQTTKVYLDAVMQKLFKDRWPKQLEALLAGDLGTLDLCAQHLAKNLGFFELLHILCLVTSTRFDLEEKDRVKAADMWLCWYGENKSKLEWDKKDEIWRLPNNKEKIDRA
ncbi:MAG: hypothetical protein HY716_09710 [Planctomycetes bacterium]|nr:hypothetical protein [Planctomycetota bacterium]